MDQLTGTPGKRWLPASSGQLSWLQACAATPAFITNYTCQVLPGLASRA
jgi:hypothetical protein